MKVPAILEFDLEDEDGDPVRDRREYVWPPRQPMMPFVRA
jgi:hypothetical protein